MNSENELKYLQKKLEQRNTRITNVWVNIKIIFFTTLTIIGLLTSLVLLPIALVLFGGVIAFIFYKLQFTDPDR